MFANKNSCWDCINPVYPNRIRRWTLPIIRWKWLGAKLEASCTSHWCSPAHVRNTVRNLDRVLDKETTENAYCSKILWKHPNLPHESHYFPRKALPPPIWAKKLVWISTMHLERSGSQPNMMILISIGVTQIEITSSTVHQDEQAIQTLRNSTWTNSVQRFMKEQSVYRRVQGGHPVS